MKNYWAVVWSFLPLCLAAQAPPAGMPQGIPPGMESFTTSEFMAQLQTLQVCMSGVDQAQLPPLQAGAEEAKARILASCASGDAAGAWDIARDYEREVREEPVVMKVQECLENAPDSIAKMMAPGFFFIDGTDDNFDICAAIE
jgi:hypothetical protein